MQPKSRGMATMGLGFHHFTSRKCGRQSRDYPSLGQGKCTGLPQITIFAPQWLKCTGCFKIFPCRLPGPGWPMHFLSSNLVPMSLTGTFLNTYLCKFCQSAHTPSRLYVHFGWLSIWNNCNSTHFVKNILTKNFHSQGSNRLWMAGSDHNDLSNYQNDTKWPLLDLTNRKW
jgi:hypothetical protein